MNKLPSLSVIIPVREISKFLRLEGFPAFEKQTFRDFEVIVVCDEKNTVGAQHVVPLHRFYPWLKIIQHPGSPSEKRNFGVLKSKGKILAFIDDDAWASKNWLENITIFFNNVGNGRDRSLQKVKVAICGPGILPKNSTFSEKVFDSVLTSKFGSANLTFRFQKEKPRFVDDYPLMNFAILKNMYLKFGGLKNHWPGEDSKLCEEIIKNGYQIQYFPKILVYHHRKRTIREFLSQHARYGFQRGLFFAEGDKNSKKFVYLLPSLFFIYLLLLPAFLFLTNNLVLLLPVLLYLFCLFIFFILKILKRRNFLFSLYSFLVLLFLHVTYAVFFIKGCISKLLQFLSMHHYHTSKYGSE